MFTDVRQDTIDKSVMYPWIISKHLPVKIQYLLIEKQSFVQCRQRRYDHLGGGKKKSKKSPAQIGGRVVHIDKTVYSSYLYTYIF